MDAIFELISHMGRLVVMVIEMSGYFGIAFLMALESTMAPLPSELVMPFAGFLAAEGKLNLWLVILFSGVGSIGGSLISYYIGRFGGNPLVRRVGKYVLLDEEDLEMTERWFSKRGEITIFVSRFIPVVRHFISIPAGIAKMSIGRFILYTFTGAILWNTILAYSGYLLRENWEALHHYMRPVSIIVFFLLMIAAAWFFYKHIAKKLIAKHPS